MKLGLVLQCPFFPNHSFLKSSENLGYLGVLRKAAGHRFRHLDLTLKRQYFFNWFHKTLKFSSHPEMALSVVYTCQIQEKSGEMS
jgi:hypothetical protein